jgi:hypothetical protein
MTKAWLLVFLLFPTSALAAPKRIVVLKADGLQFDILDEFVKKTDPVTGKSVLPWIQHVFYDHGTRVANFYSRGLSLSAPSWALLDTGQPSVIKGNLEFERSTLRAYDYLDAFSHVVKSSTGRDLPTAGAEVLDKLGIPRVSDLYAPAERYVGMQIFTRGLPARGATLKRAVTFQNPKEWFDEWTIGLQGEPLAFEVLEKDFLSKLKDPGVRYLDFMIPAFDHVAHVNREPAALLRALQQIDRAVGATWSEIQKTTEAGETVLVLVSDHGMNTDPRIYSQGYNLIDLFTSAAGGGHHVVTNRIPLGEFAFKALSPVVSLARTPSPSSYYLKGQAGKYPTLLLDADGNERASVYLRNSDMNVEQILFQQLQRKDLQPTLRAAVLRAIRFDPARRRIEEVVPPNSMGEPNTVHRLQNYVVGLAPGGLVLDDCGELDFARSFLRVNYFALLAGIQTQNNPQPGVATRPVDFIAAKLGNAIWLYRDEERQALILRSRDARGQLALRYVPIRGLIQETDGGVQFEPSPWREKLPLDLWENVPSGWLEDWHSESEWMQMTHATPYSTAILGLYEEFSSSPQYESRAVQPDFIVFANDHWNFNYRGFNPGGNHGAFFRASTHATLMFAGGGIAEGVTIDTPYDGLSFAPTLLRLAGKAGPPMPGPVIPVGN